MITKSCAICNSQFEVRKCVSNARKHCSRKCAGIAKSRKGHVTKNCVLCNSAFKVKKYRANKQRYCSMKCFRIANSGEGSCHWNGGQVTKICSVCKSEYKVKKNLEYKAATCSKQCMGIAERGQNNPRWKGGISTLRDSIRNLPEGRRWRRTVFERDNYTCQDCEIRCEQGVSVYLEAHHEKAFSVLLAGFLVEYNQFNPIEDKEVLVRLAPNYKPFWDIDNGETLCRRCHALVGKGKKIAC